MTRTELTKLNADELRNFKPQWRRQFYKPLLNGEFAIIDEEEAIQRMADHENYRRTDCGKLNSYKAELSRRTNGRAN